MLSSTERFSSRVNDYVKYRPGYPQQVLQLLRDECGLHATSKVADVGSGTGILTHLLLATGATVFAIEPNNEMRAAAERWLSAAGKFHSVNATAEATTLPAASMDLIVAAQAFHWFKPQPTRLEFTRVLKPQAQLALIWNERPVQSTAFMDAYEALLRRYAPEYDQVTSRRVDQAAIREFFAGKEQPATFANQQQFDFEGLKGRLMSSSYTPEVGNALHEPLIAGLRALFDRHQQQGQVVFPYQTLVYYGRLH